MARKSRSVLSFCRYGSHSQLQIAAALFCSLVLATWAAAEAARRLSWVWTPPPLSCRLQASSYLRQHPTAEGYVARQQAAAQ